jgi:hypothetical protein
MTHPTIDPFNLPDALEAIREEYAMTQARHQSSKDESSTRQHDERDIA